MEDGSNTGFFFWWYLLVVAMLKTVGVYPAARKLYEVASSERRLRSL